MTQDKNDAPTEISEDDLDTVTGGATFQNRIGSGLAHDFGGALSGTNPFASASGPSLGPDQEEQSAEFPIVSSSSGASL
ncbi:MAG: hypothetical protein AAF479_10565 [Pseudomonadota bacterium]